MILSAAMAFVQVAQGQVSCYSGYSNEPMEADKLQTFGNCTYCSYRETMYNGKLFEVFYGCADECEAYESNGQILECCQEDLCNAEGGSGE
ncbi:hypothetical protein EG68_05567 [Paragonimus skrjabini miyazakii]|uniref:Uncharacterized protein n=1 Tax=Paragonimus skrjabini miyazakii TaxID=59628 RepID=A0A8S9YVM8_9TREM|nr:hypothetical protein EG68_05567 [Paragonimus skrjabini miyazakii]